MTDSRKWGLSNWVILFGVFSLLTAAAFYSIYTTNETLDSLVYIKSLSGPKLAEIAIRERNAELLKLFVVWISTILIITFLTFFILKKGQSLRAEINKEKVLLENINDGVVAIDKNFVITSWNVTAELLTGWIEEETVGKHAKEFLKFINENDKKENIVFIEESMLYGETKDVEWGLLLINKDGKTIAVRTGSTPLLDPQKKVIGAIVVFHDISSERKIAKEKEDFLFRTVHDLRSPATAIKIAAENYSDPKLLAKRPEMAKEVIGLISEANSRMLNLINGLLEKAKRGMIFGDEKREAVDIVQVMKTIGREVGPMATMKEVKIVYSAAGKVPKVYATEDSLKEIFSNLIDNAIKYNRIKGTVNINYEPEGKLIKISVEDSGIGIPSRDMAKLFTPYFRGADNKEIPGTGLGLYIVKKLVEEFGGTIGVTSQVGKGAKFIVSLPIAPVEIDPPKEKS